MNRQQRRLSEKFGRAAQNRPWDKFEDVTISGKYTTGLSRRPTEMGFTRVWQNSQYLVFLRVDDRIWMDVSWNRVMVRRSDAKPLISWTDLQRIKNEIFGPEVEAIQFLPRQSQLVDEANLYWFFIRSGVEWRS